MPTFQHDNLLCLRNSIVYEGVCDLVTDINAQIEETERTLEQWKYVRDPDPADIAYCEASLDHLYEMQDLIGKIVLSACIKSSGDNQYYPPEDGQSYSSEDGQSYYYGSSFPPSSGRTSDFEATMKALKESGGELPSQFFGDQEE